MNNEDTVYRVRTVMTMTSKLTWLMEAQMTDSTVPVLVPDSMID